MHYFRLTAVNGKDSRYRAGKGNRLPASSRTRRFLREIAPTHTFAGPALLRQAALRCKFRPPASSLCAPTQVSRPSAPGFGDCLFLLRSCDLRHLRAKAGKYRLRQRDVGCYATNVLRKRTIRTKRNAAKAAVRLKANQRASARRISQDEKLNRQAVLHVISMCIRKKCVGAA